MKIRGNLGYLSVGEENNIKRDFSGMEFEGMVWMGLVSFDERGSKLRDFTEGRQFFDPLSDCYFLRDCAPWS